MEVWRLFKASQPAESKEICRGLPTFTNLQNAFPKSDIRNSLSYRNETICRISCHIPEGTVLETEIALLRAITTIKSAHYTKIFPKNSRA